MGLSTELISEFVKITNDNKKSKEDNTVYGTVKTVSADGKSGTVEIDGSNEATPVSTTCTISVGDRVRLNIRSHNAIVTGNVSDQSIGVKRAGAMESLINQTADNIRLEVSNKVDNLTSSLDITAEGIRSEVSASLAKVNANIGGLDTRITNAESSITQTATDIRSEVKASFDTVNGTITGLGSDIEGLTGRITNAESSITQTATDIRSEVKASFDTVNGTITEFSTFKQTIEGFSFMGKGGTVKISGGDINLTGAISFGDLSGTDGVLSDIAAAKSTADSASSAASDAYDLADTAWDKADNALDTVSGWAHSKDGTYINGKMIYSDSIYADRIHLGGALKVYRTKSGSTLGGYLGYDSGFNSSAGIGMRYQTIDEAQAKEDDEDIPVYSQVVCTNNAARLSYGDPDADNKYSQVVADSTGEVSLAAYSTSSGKGHVYLKRDKTVVVQTYNDRANNMFIPGSNSKIYLGKNDRYWLGIYGDNYFGITECACTSDANRKNSIEDLPDKYVELFDRLRPVRYKLNSGTSDRYHVGYIAQEVEEAMTTAGIDSQEFGGLVKDKNEDGTYTYMLRYGEFDAIRDAKIKQLEARNAELEARIEKLEKLLTQNT